MSSPLLEWRWMLIIYRPTSADGNVLTISAQGAAQRMACQKVDQIWGTSQNLMWCRNNTPPAANQFAIWMMLVPLFLASYLEFCDVIEFVPNRSRQVNRLFLFTSMVVRCAAWKEESNVGDLHTIYPRGTHPVSRSPIVDSSCRVPNRLWCVAL